MITYRYYVTYFVAATLSEHVSQIGRIFTMMHEPMESEPVILAVQAKIEQDNGWDSGRVTILNWKRID